MPKYRFLSDEELSHLEEEFKQFLIVNHVHAEEWADLNKKDPEKALEIVGLFSDQVLQRVYEKMEYLERREANSCFLFKLGAKELSLIVLQLEPGANSEADLSTVDSIHKTMINWPTSVSYFTQKKGYTKSREEEMHQLIEQGAEISSVEFWESLENTLK